MALVILIAVVITSLRDSIALKAIRVAYQSHFHKIDESTLNRTCTFPYLTNLPHERVTCGYISVGAQSDTARSDVGLHWSLCFCTSVVWISNDSKESMEIIWEGKKAKKLLYFQDFFRIFETNESEAYISYVVPPLWIIALRRKRGSKFSWFSAEVLFCLAFLALGPLM